MAADERCRVPAGPCASGPGVLLTLVVLGRGVLPLLDHLVPLLQDLFQPQSQLGAVHALHEVLVLGLALAAGAGLAQAVPALHPLPLEGVARPGHPVRLRRALPQQPPVHVDAQLSLQVPERHGAVATPTLLPKLTLPRHLRGLQTASAPPLAVQNNTFYLFTVKHKQLP